MARQTPFDLDSPDEDPLREWDREAFSQQVDALSLADVGFAPRASSRYSYLKARRDSKGRGGARADGRAFSSAPPQVAAEQHAGEPSIPVNDAATRGATRVPRRLERAQKLASLEDTPACRGHRHLASARSKSAMRVKEVSKHPTQPSAPRPRSLFDRRTLVVKGVDGQVHVLVPTLK